MPSPAVPLEELRTNAKMRTMMMMMVMVMMMMMMMVMVMASGALVQAHTCDEHYKPLPTKNLNEVFGEWHLVWGASEFMQIFDAASSAVSLHPKNDIIHLLERNKYRNNTCATYSLNVSAPVDPTSEDPLILPAVIDSVVIDGSLFPLNINFTLHFYQTSPDAMLMFTQAGVMGRFLLSYSRAGHEADAEQLISEQEKLLKMVECLSFDTKQTFVYDGADYCQAASSTTAEQRAA